MGNLSEKQKTNPLRTFGKNITAIVSVAFVLLILGIAGAMGIAASNVSDSIRENLGFTITFTDNATAAQLADVKSNLSSSPQVASFLYLSPEQILKEEEKNLDADIVDMLGVNPYTPEFSVKISPRYATKKDISALASQFSAMPGVESVKVVDYIDNVNSAISTLTIALLVIALALIIISFVLINNTVRLTIFSSRFILHAMRLVGATPAFIRGPIIRGNILNGLLSALVAIALLLAMRWYASSQSDVIQIDLNTLLPLSDLLPIIVGMMITGMLICGLAAYFASTKYLRQSYDDLF
ncbi:MAG: permease-like cell division protein FtsX [Muribaculaceae bacterium]|nr:permease-like cell division protein FtsX [Muribaculaceae bacterium]